MADLERHEDLDADVAALLRRSTPAAEREFAGGLERRLFGAERPAARRRAWRPAFAGAALAGALAASVVGLSLGGVGPLAGSGSDGANAKSDCRYVPERHVERVPRIVTGADGQARIRYKRRVVTAQVRRCR